MTLEKRIWECQKCPLWKTCIKPIPGDGNYKSKILIIGEAPGKEEDKVNKPFVGRSGKLLTKILEEIGYFRDEDYYITNIVKCRPPENRDPKPIEIETCYPYLVEQIEEMEPDLIITLGRFSFNFLVPDITISEGRGNFYDIEHIAGKKLKFPTTVLAIYHPAVALYNPPKKILIKEDLEKIKEYINNKQGKNLQL